ncbi:MAG: hypothetical protein E7426_00960 [Ruminococcaceae bacterium]|jgi:hypothetical protein|nr:hypothetical protein [Oscillospiraceae bacterium]
MRLRRWCALLLCGAMLLTLTACKSGEVRETEKLIDAIGAVTAESGTAIDAAAAAYEALSEEDRAQVENYLVLTEAQDALKVATTEKLIDDIGEVTADSEAAIDAARTAYDALNGELQQRVSNLETLTEAESALTEALQRAREEAVQGTWVHTFDLAPLICTLLNEQAKEYGLTMELDSYMVPLTLTLRAGGGYEAAVALDRMEEQDQGLYDACLPFVRQLVYVAARGALEERDYDVSGITDWDGLETALGMDEDTFFETAYGVGRDEYIGVFVEKMGVETYLSNMAADGSWGVTEDTLVLDGDVTVHYTVDGDTLTLTDGSGLWPDYPLEDPMVFERAD